jgi:hypothetical protein
MILIEFPAFKIKIVNNQKDLKVNQKMELSNLAILLSNLTPSISLNQGEKIRLMKAEHLVKRQRKNLWRSI